MIDPGIVKNTRQRDALRYRCSKLDQDPFLIADYLQGHGQADREAKRQFIENVCALGKEQDPPWTETRIGNAVGYQGRQGLSQAKRTGYIESTKLGLLKDLVRRQFGSYIPFPTEECRELGMKAAMTLGARRVDWPCKHELMRCVLLWTWHLVQSVRFLRDLGGEISDPLRDHLRLLHKRVVRCCKTPPILWRAEEVGSFDEMPADDVLIDYVFEWGPFLIALVERVPEMSVEEEVSVIDGE